MANIKFLILRIILPAVLLTSLAANGALPEYSYVNDGALLTVYPGTATRLSVRSEFLNDEMTVDVWLPPSYDAAKKEDYPVIYAHDGQNLFDPALSFSSVAWELDRIAADLVASEGIREPIIVGIHNRGEKNLRPNDYFPEKAASYIPQSEKGNTLIWETCSAGFYGDKHAAFVAKELKLLIDHLFNTSADRTDNFVMGSSMGALASLYIACEYPEVFGGAACLSTHWTGSLKMNPDFSLEPDPVCSEALLAYFDTHLPSATNLRLYTDCGTEGWDADYITLESRFRNIADRHGFSEENGSLKTFDAYGAGHNEWFWQQRADRPLRFLLNDPLSHIEENVADAKDTVLYDLYGRRTHGRGICISKGKKTVR